MMAYHITLNADGESITGLFDDLSSPVPPGAVGISISEASALLNAPGFAGFHYVSGAVSARPAAPEQPDVIFPPPWRD